jgi:hypothetical protein
MCTGRRNWTPERVSAAYEAYKRRVDEQKCLETIGMDVITLTAAFANLPNLRSVIIKSDYYRQLDVAELPKDISTIQREILLSPYHTQTLRSRDTGRLHLQHLIRAAGVTGAQITDLTILDSENAMAQAVLRLHPADLFTARRAFQHVRRFHFKLPEYTNKGSQVAIFAEGQLGELIQSMPELEELTLVASSCSPNVPWSTICGTKQLASLCSLDLQRFNFHEDEFLDFLTRHAGSLKAVSLFYVEMYSGTFMSLFHRMRDALRLDRLELDGIFKDVGGDYLDYSFWAARAIERFVTRHSLNYPSEEIFQHQRGESPD